MISLSEREREIWEEIVKVPAVTELLDKISHFLKNICLFTDKWMQRTTSLERICGPRIHVGSIFGGNPQKLISWLMLLTSGIFSNALNHSFIQADYGQLQGPSPWALSGAESLGTFRGRLVELGNNNLPIRFTSTVTVITVCLSTCSPSSIQF